VSSLSFRHLLDSNQIQESDLEKLFTLADEYHLKPQLDCKQKIVATLFFEPSTRTRFSFESAMHRLGGRVLSLENGETSSVKKGESLADTGRIVSNYADIIVMRHPKIGSVNEFAEFAHVPVINAGDGSNQHPTQSLVDVYTIFREKKTLDGLRIGILGDLKHGRAVHSLMTLLTRYKNNHFTLISHPDLGLAKEDREAFEKHGCKLEETSNLEEGIKNLDVLYVTRTQFERFDAGNSKGFKDNYCVNKKLLSAAKNDLIVLHPLPRTGEIDSEIDDLPQAKYFAQANYAVFIRMALLSLMTNTR
jgi:aspartate carbamoyltransferase catalytic subunit